MKIPNIVICILFVICCMGFGACRGSGTSSSNACEGSRPEDLLVCYNSVADSVDTRIMGRVICPLCDAATPIMINVWYKNLEISEAIQTTGPRDFVNGEFAIDASVLEGQELQLKTYVTTGAVVRGPTITEIGSVDSQNPAISNVIVEVN